MHNKLAWFAGILLLAAGSATAQMCNGEMATIVGTDGDDDLRGTPLADVIVGLGGNDRITAGDGDDIICGGDGDDDLFGQAGADLLFGDAGNDTLDGGDGTDVCDGVAGIDSASLECEWTDNTDTKVFAGTLLADDGFELDGALYVPTGDALVDGAARNTAIIISHGAMGSFDGGLPKAFSLHATPLGFSVLALNRRDAGANGGDGTQLFSETNADVGVAVNQLAALGYDSIFLVGHSQGTQNAAIYPSAAIDDRVSAVGLLGAVDDGRRVAEEVLFAVPGLYDQHVMDSQALVAQGQGDMIRPYATLFGVDLFRTPNSFLSFWGPETLSVPSREIVELDVPLLLVRADGDQITPNFYSENVLNAALAANVDATYTVLDYPLDAGFLGASAHSFVGVERELMAALLAWLPQKLPAAAQYDMPVLPVPNPSGNFEPVADAGDNETFSGNQTVELDGSASIDIDGDAMTYSWKQIDGEPLVLSGTSSAVLQIAPSQVTPTAIFELTVSTANGDSDTDTVQVSFVNVGSDALPGGSSGIGLYSLLALLLWSLRNGRLRLRDVGPRGKCGSSAARYL